MVGPNVQYTNESVVLYYDFGHKSITGVLAYAPVTLYSGGVPVISSSINSSKNTFYVIEEDSKLIENIRINIIPYYMSLYRQITESLINFSDSYNRFIKNQYAGLKLFENIF